MINKSIGLFFLLLSIGFTSVNCQSNKLNETVVAFPEVTKAMETFDVQFQIEKLEDDAFYLVVTIDMDRGSYVISPLSTDDFYLHFDISLDKNKNIVADKTLLEIPQSLPEIDSVLNIPVNFVREKTTYKKKLEVLSKDDFEIKGNVVFLLEPICIPYQVDFVIANQKGELKMKEVETKVDASYKGR